jgi:hypothetical protein
MASTIKLKNGSGAPLAGDLVAGEPALDLTNKRLYTEDSGGTVIEVGVNPAAEITANAGIALPDNQKATFGAGDDLQIYHDGTRSYISDSGTGDLRLQASEVRMVNAANTEVGFKFVEDGAASLYFNANEKLATTGSGIDVTGTVTADGGTIVSTGSDAFSSKAVGGYAIQAYQDATSSGHTALDLRSDATTGTRYLIRGYNDAAGTPTEVFSVGADGGAYLNGNAGIGFTTPVGKLGVAGAFELAGTGDVTLSTNPMIGRNSDNMLFGTSATERMRISSSGNVGINTSDPDTTLTVVGGGVAEFRVGNIGPSSNSAIRISRNDTGVSVGNPLGYLEFAGNDSTGNVDMAFAYVGAEAESSHSAGNNATALTFGVTAAGSEVPVERARLDKDGNLLVGTTSASGTKFVVNSSSRVGYFATSSASATQDIINVAGTGGAASYNAIRFWYGALDSGSVVGSVSFTSSATAYNTSSDERLKENITDAPAGNIDDIKVRSFDWKVDGSHQDYGMVAQELEAVAPYAVTKGETEDDMWSVDYSKLVPMLIKEIQDLKAEVAALKGAN